MTSPPAARPGRSCATMRLAPASSAESSARRVTCCPHRTSGPTRRCSTSRAGPASGHGNRSCCCAGSTQSKTARCWCGPNNPGSHPEQQLLWLLPPPPDLCVSCSSTPTPLPGSLPRPRCGAGWRPRRPGTSRATLRRRGVRRRWPTPARPTRSPPSLGPGLSPLPVELAVGSGVILTIGG